MRRSHRASIAALVLVFLSPGRSEAQPDGSTTEKTSKLEEAKVLFRQGLSLLDIGDPERALDYFVRSRALFPSSKNTANAAICLDRLGRYDEALELYEELVTKFEGELEADDKALIGPAMAALREKVGGLTISANVAGTAVIDGRARGALPTLSPIRLIAGKHVVRVLKDGYAPMEATVQISVGKTATLEAVLRPLSGRGMLRVEDPNCPKATVFIDGLSVGESPWEGALAPGKHVIWTRKDDLGSAPSTIVVVDGQTALARVTSGPLGSAFRVEVDPPTAQIVIDRVALGTRAWDGRLTVGPHRLVVSDAGYIERVMPLEIKAMPAANADITIRLGTDPNDPRWPKRTSGHVILEAIGGYVGGPTLRADAQLACPKQCSSSAPVNGYIVGARVAYRFHPGVAIELAGGYTAMRGRFSRTVDDHDGSGHPRVTYDLQDELRLAGPFLGIGGSMRFPFGRFGLLTRNTIGVLLARSSDTVTGTAEINGASLAVNVQNSSESVSSFPVFVSPELGGDVAIGPLELGATMAFDFFFGSAPRFGHPQVGLAKPDCPVNAGPTTIGCLGNSARLAGERAYGPFWIWSPELQARVVF